MRRSFNIAFIAVLLAAIASGKMAFADNSLVLYADYGAYRYEGESGKSYVEIYYNLLRNNLKFYPDSLGFSAFIDFQLLISDTTGVPLDSLTWRAGSRVNSLSVLDGSDYLISDQYGDIFKAGDYIAHLKVSNGGNTGETIFRMNIPAYEDTALAISSVEWAYEIKPATDGKLVKNGYHILPNASGRFQQESNVVYLYAEIYNIDVSPEADSVHTITMEIYDSRDSLYKIIDPVRYRKPGNSAVVVTGFSIAALDGGLYKMKLKAEDGGNEAWAEKSFSIIPSAEKTRIRLMESILSQYPGAKSIEDQAQAEKFRDDIAYIATTEELKLFDSLNLRGKQNFQKEFWKSRDPDPGTAINEFQLEHYRRLKYVDEHFSRHGGMMPGWRTDQGRVYILYGEPTDIERNPSSIETRSWEKWWYHGLEGGVYFIFVDYEDTDSYELIHSTKKNEVKDENWENKIKMTIYQR